MKQRESRGHHVKKHEDKEIQICIGYINVVNLHSWIARLYTHEDLECTTQFFKKTTVKSKWRGNKTEYKSSFEGLWYTMMSRLMKLIIRLGPKEIKETNPSNNWQKKKHSKCRLLSARLSAEISRTQQRRVCSSFTFRRGCTYLCSLISGRLVIAKLLFIHYVFRDVATDCSPLVCPGKSPSVRKRECDCADFKTRPDLGSCPIKSDKVKKVKLQDEEDDGPTQKGH